MKQKTEIKKKNIYKEILEVALKSLLFALCAGVLTTLTHMLSDIFIFHSHGKPEFVSTSLIIYSACDKILVAIGYYVLGRKIPVKNAILRSMAYVGLNWISNFVPQFMGLAFADGAIAEQAFRISDFVCDTITLVLLGLILGVMYRKVPDIKMRSCDKYTYRKVIAFSTIALPVIVIVADQLMSFIYPPFSSLCALQVSKQAKVPFLLNFYSWFLLSGAFIAVFYRLTEYNDKGSWLKFALKYSLLLWTPVVMIMVLFGTELVSTTAYALVFIVCIMILCRINDKILEAGQKVGQKVLLDK